MDLTATKEARQELAELRKLVIACRSDLGITNGAPPHRNGKRAAGLFRRRPRGLRQARRQMPVA